MLTILFDGIAYGMLLFILAVGLSVTMGLMNFINLAHGAFAMAGGYITVRADAAVRRALPGLPAASPSPASALLGAVLERTLYRPLYHRPHLDQVLFSIGLTFMAVAAIDYFMGSTQQIMQLPDWLRGRTEIGDGSLMLGMGHYRLFIIAVCAALTVALQYVLARTRFGSRLRASVDDQRVAAGLGINVNVVFLTTFAFGSGLAGLGGALGAEVLGLDPTFPLKFMIYFLIVVAVGGTSSITGPLLAALLLGIADVAGKYYIPKMGAFIVYSLMIVILIWRPQGLFVRTGRQVHDAADDLARRSPLAALGAVAVAGRVRRAAAAAAPCADHQRDRHRRAVRDVAGPRAGLHRHRLAGPRRLLRHGRLRRGAVRQACDARPALVGLAGRHRRGRPCWARCASVTILRGSDLTRLMVTLGVGAASCWNWPTSSTG